MRRILILWHILIPILIGTPFWLGAQNCGKADTVAIPANRTINYDILIEDVVNNDLADPNQGLCGIELHFRHTLSTKMEVFLTSPSGQRIQLMGPNVPLSVAFTFGTQWNINFVPCAETAMPDSGYIAKWNNRQPNSFVNGGFYNGSYYPFNGCLEDFNTGAVNGTWRLTITNNPSTNNGSIYYARLIFCDSRGIVCCEADAGSLAAFPDEQWCEGSDSLKLDLKPSFPVSIRPDTVEYGYTYMISRDGVLLEYDSLADLSDLPAGNYQVCGLSYRRSDVDSFPMPDGVLRLSDFRNRLNGDSLLYCGRITNNCVDVLITDGDTTLLQRDICQGEIVQVGNQTFTTAGDYFVTLAGSGGCDSTVHLELNVVPAIMTNLNLEICEGDSVQVGTSIYKTTGVYADTLAMPSGCDSIVNLNLQVNRIPTTFLTEVICQGASITIGNQVFNSTGIFDVMLTAATGCDSLVNLTLLVLRPSAQIAPPDTLSCSNPTTILDGSPSSPNGELTFLWTNLIGDTLGMDPTLQVDSAGFYILTVSQTVADFTCTSSDTVQVFSSADMPMADAGSGFEINCANPTVVIGGDSTSTGPNYTYRWHILNGNIVGDTTQRTAVVDASGEYQLIVTNTASGCSDTSSTIVTANFNPPFADVRALDTLSCEQTSIILDIANSSRGSNIRYNWRDSSGTILGNDSTQIIDAPGKYIMEVLDILNGCSARDSIMIGAAIGVPVISFGDTLIPCGIDTFSLSALVSPPNGSYAFFWNGPGVIGSGDALTTPINRPGEYIFTVVNLDNGCIINEFINVTQDTVCAPCVEVDLPDTLTCLQDTLQLTATLCEPCNNCTVQWTTPDGNIITNPNSLIILINEPGRYTITVVNENGDSTSIDLDVPQVVDFPIADAGTDQEITCVLPNAPLGGNNTSNGPGFTYRWVGLNGGVVESDSARITQTLTPDTYILTVLNTQNGCSAIDTVVVTEDTFRPIANAGVDTMLNCAQLTLTLNGTGSPNAQYSWTSQGGNIVSDANTLNPVIDAAGIYILTVRDTGTNCVAQDTVMVTPGEDSPQVPTFADEFLTCNNPSVTLDASSFVLDSMVARWCQLDSNNNVINCIDNPLLIATEGGLYRFELTDTTSGCRSTVSVRVIDNRTLPDSLDAGATDTLDCIQPSIVLNGNIIPANGNYTYRWIAVNGSLIQNDSTLTPTITLPDVYILEVTNDASGCIARDSVEILQNVDSPSVFAGFDTLLTCTLTTWQFQGTAVGNNLRYQWTTRTGNIVSGDTTLNAVVDEPGTYFLTVTNSLSNCSARDTIVIGENTMKPTAAVLNSDSLNLDCTSNSLNLDGSFSLSQTGAGLIYKWSALDGTPITNPMDSIIQVSDFGEYQLMVQDSFNGCRDSILVQVNQDTKLPELLIPSPDSITCAQDSVAIQAQLVSGNPNFSVRWINPAGQVLNDTDLNVIATLSGNYTLEITSIDNGCSDSITINVPIDTLKPTITITPPDELGCQVKTTQLIAAVIGGTSFTYNWTTQDGSITAGATTSSATADAAGTYLVLVTNITNGCTNEAAATVIESESNIQQAFFTITPANCIRQGSGFIQIDSVSGGNGPYQYSLGEFPYAPDDFFQNLRAGEYTLRVQDLNGCEWTTQVIVPQPDPITVELGNDTLINFGDTLQIIAVVDTGRLQTIVWNTNGVPSDSSTTQIFVAPLLSSQYLVEVTAENGCTATDIINVAVQQVSFVFVPNAFTPDGDGINDVFMIYAGENVKQVKVFMIFDRWGNRLLHSGPFLPNDPEHGWDGNFNGKPMDAGVYVFYAEVEIIDGRTEIVKGDITLLR